MKKILGVIPARIGSTRLPEKPLISILGKPLIQWVYENAQKMDFFSKLILATDDKRIFELGRSFGAQVEMTSKEHCSGSERVREVASRHSSDIVVNLQGDEPLIREDEVRLALSWVESGKTKMATLAAPLQKADMNRPEVVKIYLDPNGLVKNFSRNISHNKNEKIRHHVGLYVYTQELIGKWNELPHSHREKNESLEQLRALDAGIQIGAGEIDQIVIGIDTPEDVEKASGLLVKH